MPQSIEGLATEREQAAILVGMVNAILFDVGGTLIEATPSVGHVYASVAERHGIQCEPEDLNRRFKLSWQKFKGHPRQYDPSWWRLVVDDVFNTHAIPNPNDFFNDLYQVFAEPHVWKIHSDVIPTLEKLSKSFTLAIASNWDDRLPRLLQQLDLERYFAHQFISYAIKHAKPETEFFKHALKVLELDPSQVVHVGDDEENDFCSPNKVGIKSFLLDRKKRRNGNNIIHTLEALPEMVDKHFRI